MNKIAIIQPGDTWTGQYKGHILVAVFQYR